MCLLEAWKDERQKQRENHEDHCNEDKQLSKALGATLPDLLRRKRPALDDHRRSMGFGLRPDKLLIQPFTDKKYDQEVKHPEQDR